jgi:hypothetical protein
MGKASRDKGKRGEREARDQVKEHWNSPECVRTAQVSGKFSGDLMGGPKGLHLEVKRYRRIVSADFMKQAADDAQEGEVPVVLSREDGGDWLVTFRIQDTDELLRRLRATIRIEEDTVS